MTSTNNILYFIYMVSDPSFKLLGKGFYIKLSVPQVS